MAGPIQSQDHSDPISAINVTPFVDVVLVLLVIFMVTAPTLIKESLEVNLPKTQNSQGRSLLPHPPIRVTLKMDGSYQWDKKPVSIEELKIEAQNLQKSSPETQVLLSADQDLKHGQVIKIMDVLRGAGLTQLGIETELQK